MIGSNHPARLFWDVVKRMRAARPDDRTTAPHTELHVPDAETAYALERLAVVRDQCRRLVTRRASLSAGVAIVPLPGIDVGTDIAILLRLLPRINERFGLTPAQIEGLDTETRRIVMMFVGSVGSTLVGRIVTRELVVRILLRMGVRLTTQGVVKFVPLIGQAVSASISFAAMKLLGNQHIDDCYEVARRTLLEAATHRGSEGHGPKATWEVVP